MNLHTPTLDYTICTYAEDSYTLTEEWVEDNYDGGWFDGNKARAWKRGGKPVDLILNTPCCKGCDQPIVNHVCHDCSFQFIDRIEFTTDPQTGNARVGL